MDGSFFQQINLIVQDNPPFTVKVLEFLRGHVLFEINGQDALDVLLIRSFHGKALLAQGLFNAVQIWEYFAFLVAPKPDDNKELSCRCHLYLYPVKMSQVIFQQPAHSGIVLLFQPVFQKLLVVLKVFTAVQT